MITEPLALEIIAITHRLAEMESLTDGQCIEYAVNTLLDAASGIDLTSYVDDSDGNLFPIDDHGVMLCTDDGERI